MNSTRPKAPTSVRGIHTTTLELEIKADDLPIAHEKVRVFHPTASQISDRFIAEIQAEIRHSSREDLSILEDGLLLLRLYTTHPRLDRKLRRKFSLESFRKNRTLKKLLKSSQLKGRRLEHAFVDIAGESTTPAQELISSALLVTPALLVSHSEERYQSFRSVMLSDLRVLSEIANHEATPAEEWLVAERESEILVRSYEQSKKTTKRYEPIVTEVDKLMSNTLGPLPVDAVFRNAQGVDTPTPKYADRVCERLDLDRAVALLMAVADMLQNDHSLPAIRLEEIDDANDPRLTAVRELDATEIASELAPSRATEMEQVIGLLSAAISRDPREVWNALVWVSHSLGDRSECMRRLLREAEHIYLSSLESGLRSIYRDLRSEMSRAEKRLYALMYFRHRRYAFRILAFEPSVTSFATGIGEETSGLLMLVVLRRADAAARATLDSRWKAFLRFYPTWLHLIRSDENEAYRERQERDTHITPDPERSSLPWDAPKRIEQGGVNETGIFTSVELVARKVCTPKQLTVLKMTGDGMTQGEIGTALGVTQQMVSKHLKEGAARIRERLNKES